MDVEKLASAHGFESGNQDSQIGLKDPRGKIKNAQILGFYRYVTMWYFDFRVGVIWILGKKIKK